MVNPVDKLGEEKVTHILQRKQAEMLEEVKHVFEKNGIQFFLACGTALGCVRHSGFIPWDDDVDIYVFGSDYLRIKNAINNEKKTNLKFMDYSTEPNYPYWFPKIVSTDTVLVEKSFGSSDFSCGVYIDVFPLFGITDISFARKVSETVRYLRYALIRAYYNDTFSIGYRKLIRLLVRSVVNPSKIQGKLVKTYMHNMKNTHFIVDPGVFHNNALLNAESFKGTTYMFFEKMSMPMPTGYHQYLTDYYGEYMKLPPENQRVSRHNIGKLVIPNVNDLEE